MTDNVNYSESPSQLHTELPSHHRHSLLSQSLLHHYLAALSDQSLAHAAAAASRSAESVLVLESDNGLFQIKCSVLSGGGTEEGGINQAAPLASASCSLRDLMHLLLATVGGHVGGGTAASAQGKLSYSFLRQAVGVNNLTAALPGLDPRILFPSGVQVLRQGAQELGVHNMLSFLASRGLLQVTSRPITRKDPGEGEASSAGGLGAALSGLWSGLAGSQTPPAPTSETSETSTLIPNSQRAFVTLGSDLGCSYLDSFLR
jgi:hypothetical protein